MVCKSKKKKKREREREKQEWVEDSYRRKDQERVPPVGCHVSVWASYPSSLCWMMWWRPFPRAQPALTSCWSKVPTAPPLSSQPETISWQIIKHHPVASVLLPCVIKLYRRAASYPKHIRRTLRQMPSYPSLSLHHSPPQNHATHPVNTRQMVEYLMWVHLISQVHTEKARIVD